MKLILTVYTDEYLTEVKRVIEVDHLKVPYRVALEVAKSLDDLDLDNETDVLSLISGNIDRVDKIIKATFGVTDSELECVDVAELGSVATEIYKWAIDKFNGIKGGQEKN